MPFWRAYRTPPSTTCILSFVIAFLPCLAAEYVQKNLTDVAGYKLASDVASIPAPVRVAPDQDWKGIDGLWNTFSLFIGEPRQNARVLVSTTSQQIWAINRLACVSNVTDPDTEQILQYDVSNPDCEDSRGHNFNVTESSTWTKKGYYQLWIGKPLGLVGNGLYGFDDIAMGFPGEEGPSTVNSTVGTLVTADFWLGHIGLHHKPTNFSKLEPPAPSYMMNLFDQGSIPSMAFGYTAGAQYHGRTALSSLTLGGYDASRIIPNDLTFNFAPDNERDIVVDIVGLSANTSARDKIDMLARKDVNVLIDSTVAELWLPVEICEVFEETFGLKHDADTDLYLVNDAVHASLLAQDLSVTFTLGQPYRTDSEVQITLPYAAFDLVASPPYRGLREKTRYFPLRRGNESYQWVLGRTFLQEAYLTVDWERQNFSVSAVNWTFGNAVDLRPIVHSEYLEPAQDSSGNLGLSSEAIIGISVGSGMVLVLILIAVGWGAWRRHQKQRKDTGSAQHAGALVAAAASIAAATETSDGAHTLSIRESEEGTTVFPKAELPGGPTVRHELAGWEKEQAATNEVDSTESCIHEMPGDVPTRQEAGGRQLSEKETMLVRERTYNGFDPNKTPGTPPTMEEAPRRPAPISPLEVTMLSGQLPSYRNVSPVMPRTPRDGALLEASDTFFRARRLSRRNGKGIDAEEELLSPISPLETPGQASRRRFSYES